MAANQKKKVAYLGPAGTFTHEAAMKVFPKSKSDLIEASTLNDVFDSAYHGECDYAVLPVENSTEGIVGVTYHGLVDQADDPKVTIQGEIYMNIAQNLAAISHTVKFEQVKFVHSKDQAWAQCRKWIERHLPKKVEFVEEPSTSFAAQRVFEHGSMERVAICGSLAAELNKLECIAQNIEDHRSNTTRFFIIGSRPLHRRTDHVALKATLALVLQDRVGALADTFAIFARHKVDIRTVKVAPVRAPEIMTWKDWFFVDVVANDGSFRNIDAAIAQLNAKSELVLKIRVLGRYPSGESNKVAATTAEQSRISKKLTLQQLIAASEGSSVEFKSSLRWNIRELKKDSAMEAVVIKTIAGFMNAQGGTLVIGVDDKGIILGLEDDYKTMTKKQDADGFELHLRQITNSEIGVELAHLVDIRFESKDGKAACLVTVQPSPKPIWVQVAGKDEFYLRVGNQTKPLDSRETAEYVRLRWT